MPVEVILPKVDMDMETGSIEAWKVSEGDFVKQGDILFEIGTNKAVMEVEAPASGIIRNLVPASGEPIAVGTPVAWIFLEGEDASDTPPPPAAETAAAPQAQQPPASPSGEAASSAAPASNARNVASAPSCVRDEQITTGSG